MNEDKKKEQIPKKMPPLKEQKWTNLNEFRNLPNKMKDPKITIAGATATGLAPPNEAYFQIQSMGQEVIDMLLQKNIQYGNSVLSPKRIFSKADTSEQIKVRIDDKLNRLISGNDSIESDEDVIFDLIGYLILLLVHNEHYTQTLQGDSET